MVWRFGLLVGWLYRCWVVSPLPSTRTRGSNPTPPIQTTKVHLAWPSLPLQSPFKRSPPAGRDPLLAVNPGSPVSNEKPRQRVILAVSPALDPPQEKRASAGGFSHVGNQRIGQAN